VLSPPGGNSSYLLNGIVDTKPLAAIPAPADVIYLHEVRNKHRLSQVKPLLVAPRQARSFTSHFYDGVHNGGANLLFCDGHAKWQRRDGIRYAQFGAPTALNPGLPTNLPLSDIDADARNSLVFNTEF
jgi:prepilin-type processing-associated H-X9-DG protein